MLILGHGGRCTSWVPRVWCTPAATLGPSRAWTGLLSQQPIGLANAVPSLAQPGPRTLISTPGQIGGTSALTCVSLQVHELGAMRVVHASRYPGPILSMGLAPDCSLLAVGLADGTLSLRRHARAGKTAPGTPC